MENQKNLQSNGTRIESNPFAFPAPLHHRACSLMHEELPPLFPNPVFFLFENLLNNILKYSLSHSRVYVDIINEKSQVRILFRNISAIELPDDVSRLTERFVRGDASRQTEGCGLGLAIVKSFVELQHGKLDISMDGDLFKVTILWNK